MVAYAISNSTFCFRSIKWINEFLYVVWIYVHSENNWRMINHIEMTSIFRLITAGNFRSKLINTFLCTRWKFNFAFTVCSFVYGLIFIQQYVTYHAVIRGSVNISLNIMHRYIRAQYKLRKVSQRMCNSWMNFYSKQFAKCEFILLSPWFIVLYEIDGKKNYGNLFFV